MTFLAKEVILGIDRTEVLPMIDKKNRDLFPGAIEMMVLKLLMFGPLHGYALAQRIKQTSDELLRIEEGSLYPALQRMLKEGWLDSEWGTSATNRRIRVYNITATGKKKLQHELSEFEQMIEGFTRVMKAARV